MMTRLTLRYDKRLALLHATDSLTHRDLDVLRYYIDDALMRSVALVAIDLAEVTSMDSAALGALLTGHRRAMLAGSSLVLVAPSTAVLRRLELANLDTVFPMVPEIPAAWAALASS